jgi:hypothetical protein
LPHGHAGRLGVGPLSGARSGGSPSGVTRITPRGAGGLRDHARDGAAIGALLRAAATRRRLRPRVRAGRAGGAADCRPQTTGLTGAGKGGSPRTR